MRRIWAVEGEEVDPQSEEVRMDEETISKLRKAEEEADQLRKELASLRANRVCDPLNVFVLKIWFRRKKLLCQRLDGRSLRHRSIQRT